MEDPSNVITIPAVVSNSKEKVGHPTQKPVALIEYLIKTYSNEDDLILDNTMGSGTTAVACINTNRKFIGIELDENYYNIACKRVEEAKEFLEIDIVCERIERNIELLTKIIGSYGK